MWPFTKGRLSEQENSVIFSQYTIFLKKNYGSYFGTAKYVQLL